MRSKIYKALAVLLAVLLLPQAAVLAEEAPDAEPVVVVLDPGHGGKDGGATRRWNGKTYSEKSLNLSIAKACKKQLETYAGIKVYLTRTGDTYVSLENRVKYAKKKDADLFVALHNNSSPSSYVHGTCVYYPNSNYRAAIGQAGKEAASDILKRLVSLGMKNNGISIRNTEDGSRYANKTRADYYYVIKHCKCAKIPAIIVEHAYVSNYSDCKNYLSSEAKLKKLGKADALGIADYFDLMPEGAPELDDAVLSEDGSVTLTWEKLAKADSYRVYRCTDTDGEYECIAEDVTARTYTDTETEPGVVYEYAVCGVSEAWNTYTELSNAVSAAIPAAQEEPADTEGAEDTENTESTENTENTADSAAQEEMTETTEALQASE